MISTRDLSGLPFAQRLKNLAQSLATGLPLLFFRFKVGCGRAGGQGDSWFCVFAPAGAFLKGFAHESPMSPWSNEDHSVWPGVLDDVPTVFMTQGIVRELNPGIDLSGLVDDIAEIGYATA